MREWRWLIGVLFLLLVLGHAFLSTSFGVSVGDVLSSNAVLVVLFGLLYVSFSMGIKKNVNSVGFIVMTVMAVQVIVYKIYLDKIVASHFLGREQILILAGLFFVYLIFVILIFISKLNKM